MDKAHSWNCPHFETAHSIQCFGAENGGPFQDNGPQNSFYCHFFKCTKALSARTQTICSKTYKAKLLGIWIREALCSD